MHKHPLSEDEHRQLVNLVRFSTDPTVLRRVIAVLAIDRGETPADIATWLYVSRATVYLWVQRFYGQPDAPLLARLTSRARPGRPPAAHQQLALELPALLASSPREHGYQAQRWTLRLIQRHLAERHQLTVSLRSIQRTLRALGRRPG
ncbi:MAG TPA: helix-turn-helix domain-containing protein [Herpetosiphonaceae bacterium]|nr:helix-turn-helix domain-containing protein [Herpetosiphonaceae bacterium]